MTADLRSLLVLSEPPLREGRAVGRCQIAMLRGLRLHGVEVRALAARQHFALPGAPPEDLNVEIVDVPPAPPGWRTRLAHLRHPLGDLANGIFAERVAEEARSADLVHFEEVTTVGCRSHVGIPCLVHLHYLIRQDRDWGLPWRRQFRQVLEFERAERSAMNSRWLVASSPRVAEELRRRSKAYVQLAPLSLDPDDYPVAPLDGPPTAGIIGTAAWPTTAAAIRRLVVEVWPRIRRLAPDARLCVAGRGTDALGVEAPGVDVLGQVPSAVDFLRGLSVLVFPIERGSGMKVKTLESLACGLPIVTTANGAEGIDGGEGVMVESEPDKLASAAAELLRDSAARRERGAAARGAFEARYSPLPATAPLVELYRLMAESA